MAPPVLLTQAAMDKGVETVVAAIGKHREYLREHVDAARESERRTREFVEVLSAELEERTARAVADGGAHSCDRRSSRGQAESLQRRAPYN